MTERTRRAHPALIVLLVLLPVLASCGGDEPGPAAGDGRASSSPSSRREPALSGRITVAAAASLTESFEEIGTGFEAAHPGTEVTFTFDSSRTLAAQVLEGADVDVYASADEQDAQTLVDADLVDGSPTTFARNQLVIVTRPGNPAGIETLADLAGAGVVSLCGEDVPCGRLAALVLARAGVTLDESRVTRGQNVKATLTAVTDGDAVAGIVYVTDAVAAGGAVDRVDIPEDANAVAVYPVSVLRGASDTPLAEAFVAYVLGDEGRRVLKEHGFLPPA